jgi:hypothetical protein
MGVYGQQDAGDTTLHSSCFVDAAPCRRRPPMERLKGQESRTLKCDRQEASVGARRRVLRRSGATLTVSFAATFLQYDPVLSKSLGPFTCTRVDLGLERIPPDRFDEQTAPRKSRPRAWLRRW